MKDVPKYLLLLLMMLPLMSFWGAPAHAQAAPAVISDWQVLWEFEDREGDVNPASIRSRSQWIDAKKGMASPPRPDGAVSSWNRFTLPKLPPGQSAVLIERVKGQDVSAFLEELPLYEVKRNFVYMNHTLLLPVTGEDAGKTVYIWSKGTDTALGIQGDIVLGEYEHMRGVFIKKDLEDFILGGSLLFIAAVMTVCCLFLPRHTVPSWLALCVVIFAFGALLIAYSPFLYTFYGDLGSVWVTLFDTALFAIMPAMFFYFEKIYGPGPYRIIRYGRRFQMGYSGLCLILLIVQLVGTHPFPQLYYLFTVKILGILIILELSLLIGITILYASKRNKDAYIFSFGFGIMALLTLGDLISFYMKDSNYEFYLWKWGVIALVVSLIVMLGRKFVRSHQQVLEYSRELELFNNELQRSEKMEIISELAASVAHEVRNPLQVTRGFMQLLSQSAKPEEKEYFALALKEMDRASGIITDFLTFAKPQVEQIVPLNVYEELKHVTGILLPLANLAGGTIELEEAEDLCITGNSSKLKQAMINIVKNGIEALDGEGTVRIWAYAQSNEVIIHIQDNGVGMDALELSRLGEPYFSNKSKGTGLGLMVTYRIIKSMNGTIHFNSRKGVGTEAIIRFPACASNHQGNPT
ncbi:MULTISPECIES: HAMP domain-containing sensor histidine kinase [Paenibacillus]|uniref:sensor histidine kinase n=1 Tax=Paenibacillus TaxID=44249 RepID=UPI001B2F5A83|nr:HAMP domain-containing sensor histidine kinase [Paenibacillus lactis]GIO92817.1 hypothetical protein J31TS3_40440 [Paenibacillus lactis]